MVTTRASKPVEEAKKKAEEAEKKDAMEVEKTPAQKEEEKKNLIIQDIKIQLKEVEKAGHVKEPRMISKVRIITALIHLWMLFRFYVNYQRREENSVKKL